MKKRGLILFSVTMFHSVFNQHAYKWLVKPQNIYTENDKSKTYGRTGYEFCPQDVIRNPQEICQLLSILKNKKNPYDVSSVLFHTHDTFYAFCKFVIPAKIRFNFNLWSETMFSVMEIIRTVNISDDAIFDLIHEEVVKSNHESDLKVTAERIKVVLLFVKKRMEHSRTVKEFLTLQVNALFLLNPNRKTHGKANSFFELPECIDNHFLLGTSIARIPRKRVKSITERCNMDVHAYMLGVAYGHHSCYRTSKLKDRLVFTNNLFQSDRTSRMYDSIDACTAQYSLLHHLVFTVDLYLAYIDKRFDVSILKTYHAKNVKRTKPDSEKNEIVLEKIESMNLDLPDDMPWKQVFSPEKVFLNFNDWCMQNSVCEPILKFFTVNHFKCVFYHYFLERLAEQYDIIMEWKSKRFGGTEGLDFGFFRRDMFAPLKVISEKRARQSL